MRRVECRNYGVVVEEVPWGDGKYQLTRAYMLFLARWARKLSWKETAEAFHTSWDQVCDAVAYVVGWGRQHRRLESIRAIGVDEIQYAKGHIYLTLVYQIDPELTPGPHASRAREGNSGGEDLSANAGRVISHDRLGGLHHRYDRAA
jgi:transposase